MDPVLEYFNDLPDERRLEIGDYAQFLWQVGGVNNWRKCIAEATKWCEVMF